MVFCTGNGRAFSPKRHLRLDIFDYFRYYGGLGFAPALGLARDGPSAAKPGKIKMA